VPALEKALGLSKKDMTGPESDQAAAASGEGALMPGGQLFVARLIVAGTVRQAIELEAPDATRAWIKANDGIDPLFGCWVEVQPKPEPQGELRLT